MENLTLSSNLLRDIDTATSERLRWYDCVKNLSISKKPHRRDISATWYGPLAIRIIPALLVPFEQSTALFGFRSLVDGITTVGNCSVASPTYHVAEGDKLAALKPLK